CRCTSWRISTGSTAPARRCSPRRTSCSRRHRPSSCSPSGPSTTGCGSRSRATGSLRYSRSAPARSPSCCAISSAPIRPSWLGRVAELPPTELAAAVQSLMAAEFLYEEAPYPEVEYAFKHPLTQEVAYRSQLGERRARVHATLARAVEELHRDKLDERAGLLA